MRRILAICVSAVLFAGVSAASACQGTTQLLNDPFVAKSSRWSATTDFEVGNGSMSITTRRDKSEKVYSRQTFSNVDACADVIVTRASDLASAYVGLAFWMEDVANLYAFQITLDGFGGVYRLNRDEWETLVADKPTDAINQGIGSINTVRVVTIGNKASLYVNGKKFETLTGHPPGGGQHVGFVVEPPADETASFEFRNMNVTSPAK